MNNRTVKIFSSIMLVLILCVSFTFGRPKKAEALFGVGDFNYSDAVNLAKDAAFVLLSAANHVFVSRFVQKAQQNYKINDFLNYTRNVADNVYVGDQILNKHPIEKYKMIKIIQELRGEDTGATIDQLDMLYAREANDKSVATQVAKTSVTDREHAADFLLNLNKAADVLQSTPQGRRLLATSQAQGIMATADAAASLSLQSPGYKSSYQCRKRGTDSVQQSASYVSCVVRDPTDYITSQVDTKLQSIMDEQVKPNDGLRAILQIVATKYAEKLSNRIFNTNSSSNSLFNDLNVGINH